MAEAISAEALQYLFHHVFLPPKLPQSEDSCISMDVELLKQCYAALEEFGSLQASNSHLRWYSLAKMVGKMLEATDGTDHLLGVKLDSQFKNMEIDDILALHIRSQNAGLIIRRLHYTYSFESFELSSTNESVMCTSGRLLRSFPGPAITIEGGKFADVNFRKEITELLAILSSETPTESKPISRKASSSQVEIRDTIHPRFVTEFFMGMLRAIGDHHDPQRVRKHTRDDVLRESALSPWRRSPLWLLLRVAMQTTLATNDGQEGYKSFMIYFLARILNQALASSTSSQILHIMMSKISRRAIKLELEERPFWSDYVLKAMASAGQCLRVRWNIEELNKDPHGNVQQFNPSSLFIQADSVHSLRKLGPYIDAINSRATSEFVAGSFKPNSCGRIELIDIDLPDIGMFSSLNRQETLLHLQDLETWVRDLLPQWMNRNFEADNTCIRLSQIMDEYYTNATGAYAKDPERTSLMLLTMIELWIALDRCAIRQYPMLQEYNPGFLVKVFEPLLLRLRVDMKRLFAVEQYIKSRKESSLMETGILTDFGTANSFGVRYFDQSPELQDLRQSIETKAAKEHLKKIAEITRVKQRYKDLIDEFNSLICDQIQQWDRRQRKKVLKHSASCLRCCKKGTADNLSIDVYEWPLPSQDLEAKATIFEINIPLEFSTWRDTTFKLLVDIFSPPTQSKERGRTFSVTSCNTLCEYVKNVGSRIQIQSATNSFCVAHYKTQKAKDATVDSICVTHALHYSLYENWTSLPVHNFLNSCDIRDKCTLELPPGVYRSLQRFVSNTTHTSNDALACQSECPTGLTLHEFYSFATLRSGHRLQSRNIARELVSGTMNFNDFEVGMLVCQAIWQVGPADSASECREASCDLEGAEFGLELLATLEETLTSVEGNWQGANSVRTFVAIGSRLLSLSNDEKVQKKSLEFLLRCRRVSLEWAHILRDMLQTEKAEDQLAALRIRMLEIALICYGTFDIDEIYLKDVLSIPENHSIAIECSIILHDCCPPATDQLSDAIQSLLRRYQHIVYRLEALLRFYILKDPITMDNAIRGIWSGYEPGMQWKTFQRPNERWVMTETSTDNGQRSLMVHFNILDGTLLVNGTPIARLPQAYESQDIYRRLFGERILDVVPSAMANMSFATRDEYCGYHVHFGMWNAKVIVRSMRKGVTYEYIPSAALEGDFPQPLIDEYTQWLKVGTKLVELRPLLDSWKPPVGEWQLEYQEGIGYSLIRGSTRLIDITKRTAEMISRLINPLEAPKDTLVELDIPSGYLKICLPRLKLEFFLHKGDSRLHSKQFRGMVVDEDQSFGSLTGLVSKLVLRHESGADRLVLIPQGSVSFYPVQHHVAVSINTTSQKAVKYHVYDINSLLGQIRGKSLTGELYRAYLHAVTSNDMIDKLTGQTGTEEALTILKAASTRSFLTLNSVDLEILEMISKLTPRREYYPKHLTSMQTVQWNALSPLCQHPSFFKEVSALLSQAQFLKMFTRDQQPLPEIELCGSITLLERAIVRESAFRIEGFGAEDYNTQQDLIYQSRDIVLNSLRERETCRIAGLVERLSTQNNASTDLLADLSCWNVIRGLTASKTFRGLGFSLEWLKGAEEIFPEYWLTIHNILAKLDLSRDKYKLMVFLSTFAYSTAAPTNRAFIETILSIATHPYLRTLELPSDQVFNLRDQYGPNQTTTQHLRELVEQHSKSFHNRCPEAKLPPLRDEDPNSTLIRRMEQYVIERRREIDRLVEDLSQQWPTKILSTPVGESSRIYINLTEAMKAAQALFDSWHRNSRFKIYAQSVTHVVNENRAETPSPDFENFPFVDPQVYSTNHKRYFQLDDLTQVTPLVIPQESSTQIPRFSVSKSDLETDYSELHHLLSRLAMQHPHGHGEQYVKNLMTSYDALSKSPVFKQRRSFKTIQSYLSDHKTNCKRTVEAMYCSMIETLYKGSTFAVELAGVSGLLPRTSPVIILRKISRNISGLNTIWYDRVVAYGVALTAFQRAERLLSCGTKCNELLEELRNTGHTTWDPLQHPDWLLLEIENNILIRQEQVQIANEMISPPSGKNSVMQLNMGLGKSSVIVPMVAACLADGKKLVNIIVLKSLSTQMFQLLVRKLGGFLNRRIFHMPLSRTSQFSLNQVQKLRECYEECMKTGGLSLVQPEYLLSFMLMGYDQILAGNVELGKLMIDTQQWLDQNSRDILDESDEILSVKFELIYTIGTQCSIDFSPNRWTIIQEVLAMILRFAQEVARLEPNTVEILDELPGKFSRLRVLQKSASDKIIHLITEHFCQSGYLTAEQRCAMKLYLTDIHATESDCIPLREILLSPNAPDLMKKRFLLIRGLLAGGIINFVFGLKRWRVNYGLDTSRTALAVPYRAKDKPAARAEFSHPDATIILTCLSYYYRGLSNEEISASFERVFKSDHAQEEYDLWVKDLPHMPAKFCQLTGVNLGDTGQCHEYIFPQIRFAKNLIDFYLNNIVFPKEMKEFPYKLSASGWDLARKKTYPTTGFSGTNDSRYLLPISIEQCDQHEQRCTNALQLNSLLRPENTYEDVFKLTGSEVLNADVLIRVALSAHPPVRVILDVGAQVLELGSEGMAGLWLSKVAVEDVQAIIFVDNNEELVVLYRDGTKESLATSSFAKQIDQCLVYLDEAHTRGTDLRMPEDYRAIVTLGPNLVKDRLVQACMRLRKFGKGQSALFCAPLEVHLKILASSCKDQTESINIEDVLIWSINETLLSTRRSIPLWATQGIRNSCHQAKLQSCTARNTNKELTLQTVKGLRDSEAQTLEQRYGFNQRQVEEEILLKQNVGGKLEIVRPQLDRIRERYEEMDLINFQSSTLQEEQERELSPENEREAQVERPPRVSPRLHSLHDDVKNLVLTGKIGRNSHTFVPAFRTLSDTTAAQILELDGWSQNLFVTGDFTQTITFRTGDHLDDFLRPVNWILSTKGSHPTLIIISPYEAQELVPLIRYHNKVRLHSYTPRTRNSMRSIEDLKFCVTPSLPQLWTIPDAVTELNIFAGQLYLRGYEQYVVMCRLLGLCYQVSGEGAIVASDGFVSPASRSNFDVSMAAGCKFNKSPVDFLRMLMSFRRKGMSIESSHLGKILAGRLLTEEDFES